MRLRNCDLSSGQTQAQCKCGLTGKRGSSAMSVKLLASRQVGFGLYVALRGLQAQFPYGYIHQMRDQHGGQLNQWCPRPTGLGFEFCFSGEKQLGLFSASLFVENFYSVAPTASLFGWIWVSDQIKQPTQPPRGRLCTCRAVRPLIIWSPMVCGYFNAVSCSRPHWHTLFEPHAEININSLASFSVVLQHLININAFIFTAISPADVTEARGDKGQSNQTRLLILGAQFATPGIRSSRALGILRLLVSIKHDSHWLVPVFECKFIPTGDQECGQTLTSSSFAIRMGSLYWTLHSKGEIHPKLTWSRMQNWNHLSNFFIFLVFL